MEGTNALESSRLLVDQIADKWTILILGALCRRGGSSRFNAILRDVTGLSQKTLTQCLRRMERNGMIERRVLDTAPIGVEYAITPLGHTLRAPFQALYDWATTYLSEVESARLRFDARNARVG